MNKWAIFAIALSQIVVFYFLIITPYLRLLDGIYFSRNRAWLAEHPELTGPPKVSSAIFHGVGAAWLALMAYSLSLPQGIDARLLSVAPTLVWLLMLGIYHAFEYHRIYRKIPLPAKRSAPFLRRALRDYVGRRWTWPLYAAYAGVVAVYIVADQRGTIEHAIAAPRLLGLSFMIVLSAAILLYILRRKQQPIDIAWGPTYRQIEVIGFIIMSYAMLILLGAILLQDFYAYAMFSMVDFFAVTNLILQASSIGFFVSKPVQALLTPTPLPAS